MDMKAIRSLAEIMKENSLTRVEIVEEGKTIRMEREAPVAAPSFASAGSAPAIPATAPVMASVEPHYEETPQDGMVIESPMVGMYYASPSPGEEPFVKTGSHVKKGDVLCIIEAMKNMNEITADCDGQILQIYARNGQLVEVGQRLFLVREEE